MGTPVTIWRPASGNGEYSNISTQILVDTASISVVDTTGTTIRDTGVSFSQIPLTIWTENNGV